MEGMTPDPLLRLISRALCRVRLRELRSPGAYGSTTTDLTQSKSRFVTDLRRPERAIAERTESANEQTATTKHTSPMRKSGPSRGLVPGPPADQMATPFRAQETTALVAAMTAMRVVSMSPALRLPGGAGVPRQRDAR